MQCAFVLGSVWDTIVMNKGGDRLQKLDEEFMGLIKLFWTSHNIAEEIKDADIIVGAILCAWRKTPVFITRRCLRHEKGR